MIPRTSTSLSRFFVFFFFFIPEEGLRAHGPKCCTDINKDEDNSPKNRNITKYQTVFKKMTLYRILCVQRNRKMDILLLIISLLQQCPACLVRLTPMDPAYGQAKAGRPARTYIQQLCEDTGCSPEDQLEAMNDREKWRERVWDIRASGTTWWWWFLYSLESFSHQC